MREEKFEVYSIEEVKELNEEFYKKEVEKEREYLIETNFEFLEDDLKCIAREKYNLNDIHLEYSLSYSQGDGLRFCCADLLESKYIYDKVKEKLTKGEKIKLTKLINDGLVFYSADTYSHYCYCSKSDIDYKNTCYYGYTYDERKEEFIDKIRDIVADIYVDICKEFEKIGYGCYKVSDEDAIDDLNGIEAEYIKVYGNSFVRY